MTDTIIWINHAGYELRAEGLRIVADPWIEGLAFADSWAQLSQTQYPYGNFEGVDYIWISHEHPDHFAPANLRKIPEQIRRDITVLFQKTHDGRVAAFCRKAGFKVREMNEGEPLMLSDKVRFRLGTVGADSWSYLETPERTYLNMNDCVPPANYHKRVMAKLPRPVDVLMTQFSYACWAGNPGDHAAMAQAAAQKKQQMQNQIAAYSPKILIPFASYIWFCRKDNFHLNAGGNRIGDIAADFFRENYECVVLYPGDTYAVGHEHDTQGAIRRYRADAGRHAGPLDIEEPPCTNEELEELDAAYRARICRQNTLWPLKLAALMGKIRPVKLYLTDTNQSLAYSMFGGITWTRQSQQECDLALSSSMFSLLFKYGYGFGTLNVSGRFLQVTPGARNALSRNFAPLRYNEMGYSFPNVFFNPRFVRSHLLNAPS